MDESIKQITDLVVHIASQLGFEAARIWPQMVLITWTKSLCYLIIDLVVIVGLLVGVPIIVRRCYARWDQSGDEGPLLLLVGTVFVGVVAMVIAVLDLPGEITGVMWPEAKTVLQLAGR